MKCLLDKPKELIPEYLYLWEEREFLDTDFMSIASVRNNLIIKYCKIEIPVPSLKVQQSIIDILEVYEN